MTKVTQAEFARLKGVSRKSITKWKTEGRLVIVDGLVDIERTQERLLSESRGRAKGRRAAVTLPPADGAKVTDANAPWSACGVHLDGEDHGALAGIHHLAAVAPAVLSLVVAEVGFTDSQADRLLKQFRVSMMETVGLLLDAMAVPPPQGIESWQHAPMWCAITARLPGG